MLNSSVHARIKHTRVSIFTNLSPLKAKSLHKRSSGTLAVDVKPSPGKRIVIRFYGTKKGFDETIGDGREYRLEDLAAQKGKELPKWLEGKCRTFREFSDDIGVVLKEVKGT